MEDTTTILSSVGIKPVITVSLHRRPTYTKQILDALDRCELSREVPIIIRIDPYTEEVTDKLFRLAKDFCLDLKNRHIRINIKQLGCNRTIFTCLTEGFEEGDYVIHLEDDILLAKDAIRWFIEEGEIYRDLKSTFSVCGYQRENPTRWLRPEENDKLEDILGSDIGVLSFYPWGWATWKDRWEEIKDKWAFGQHKWGGTWDLWMKKELRGNRQCILPLISRVKNIGSEDGTYTPSKEWFLKKHTVNIWSDDIWPTQNSIVAQPDQT